MTLVSQINIPHSTPPRPPYPTYSRWVKLTDHVLKVKVLVDRGTLIIFGIVPGSRKEHWSY